MDNRGQCDEYILMHIWIGINIFNYFDEYFITMEDWIVDALNLCAYIIYL